MRQAWIAGATGLVGHLLSEKLSVLATYETVFNLVRQPRSLKTKAVDVVVNYDQLAIPAQPESDFFCCLGSTIKKAGSQDVFRRVDEHYVVRFAEEAKKSQAHCLVIISATGANPNSVVFYNRVKGQMEDRVRRMGLRSVYILRPSLLLGERAEHRPAEKWASRMAPLISSILRGPLRKYRPIQASRVAEIAMQCAAQGESGFHILEGFE